MVHGLIRSVYSLLLQDVDWFVGATGSVLREELQVTHVPLEPYFVDFLSDPPEPTGDEPDDADLDAPKIYEQVSTIIMSSLRLYW